MTWLRSLWTRWIASPDPVDAVDSDFMRTTGVTVPWDDISVPGEATHAMMVKRFPRPTDWDALSDRRNERSKG